MRLIVSPAKRMVADPDAPAVRDLPVFVREAERLRDWMRGLSYDELKALWRCNDAIATQNVDRLSHMDLRCGLTPAILAYDGIQYTYMAPTVFEERQIAWVQEHLRILSGLYGVLRPLDGVTPHRLEMQARIGMDGHASLYDFWGPRLRDEVLRDGRVLVNLASKEYSRCVERWLQPEDREVTCVFGELVGDRVVQRGVYVKMARGEMVRHIASKDAQEPEAMRDFCWSGYAFDEARSTSERYVFLRSGTTRPARGASAAPEKAASTRTTDSPASLD